MSSVIWFREDLRTHDNTALHYASENSDDGLIGLYVLNYAMWHEHHTAHCRIEFILRGLAELSASLEKYHIPLIILSAKDNATLPHEILTFAKSNNVNAIYFNRQYEVNESRRDQTVETLLRKHSISCHTYHDQTILAPNSITTLQGTPYKVFTPYKRAWYQAFMQTTVKTHKPLKKQKILNIRPSAIPASELRSSINPTLWPAGEKQAEKRLKQFINKKLFQYDTTRDFPALDGTSQLSPYLAAGMISPRQCFLSAFDANQHQLDTGSKGAVTWMNELIWREFYKVILMTTPRISMHRAYKAETETIPWKFDQALLSAWQQGTTGIPIIDAAMRQLNTTGWMHNRLRMITAMFFTKNLFFDWRLGEKYFMSQLIDGDLAANNGGWQWCASTGTDAAPYFRIFNPIEQSKRFDANGDFIRHYCPELSKLNSKEIHKPVTEWIVKLKTSREHAINAFKSLA